MAKSKRASTQQDRDTVQDEPGAKERFGKILKRALHTPPSRKGASGGKPKGERDDEK